MSSGCQGFLRKRKTRARLMAEMSAGGSVKPVRTMPATSGLRWRNSSSSSTPVIPGMRWSAMTTSRSSFLASSSASGPDCASKTRYPDSRKFRRTVRFGRSSSTMRIPRLRVSPTPCRAMSVLRPSSSIAGKHEGPDVLKATFQSRCARESARRLAARARILTQLDVGSGPLAPAKGRGEREPEKQSGSGNSRSAAVVATRGAHRIREGAGIGGFR